MASKLIAELVLEANKMQAGLKKAQSSVNRAARRMGQQQGKTTAGGIASGLAANTAVIAAALSTALTAGAAVAVYQLGKRIAAGVKEAAENERFQMRFEVLTGSRGQGNRALADLREDAMRTGVTLQNMADNVGKFIAFGFAEDEALALQRGILDVGGAVGLTNRDMKLLGVALSQIAAKGCHGIDSPIRMRDGSVKMVQDIVPGDVLMGPDGGPRWVRYLARGRQMMFQVQPTRGHIDGNPQRMPNFDVNLDHKMRVSVRDGVPFTLTVEQYLAMPSEVQSALRLVHADHEDVHFFVKPIGEGDFYGFNISGDHLYLDGHGFEHHNTAQMEELRQQVAEKGIPIFKALEQQLGVTGAELSKMIQEGKVGADVVMDIFKGAASGEGPFARFTGGAEKMANTFLGKIAVIQVKWQEFLRVFGAPIREALVPFLEIASTHMDNMLTKADSWGRKVANVVTYVAAIATEIQKLDFSEAGENFRETLRAATIWLQNQMNKVMMAAISGSITFMMDSFSRVFGVLRILFGKDMRTLMENSFRAGTALLQGQLLRAANVFLQKMEDGLGPLGELLVGGQIRKNEKNIERQDRKLQSASEQRDAVVGGVAAEIGKVYANSVKKAGDAAIATYRDTSNAFGEASINFGDSLRNLKGRVDETYDSMRKFRDAELARKDAISRAGSSAKKGGDSAFSSAGGSSPVGGVAFAGRIAQAVNAIQGRSAFAVIATEGQKTNAKLDRTNRLLEDIGKNTRPQKSGRTYGGANPQSAPATF